MQSNNPEVYVDYSEWEPSHRIRRSAESVCSDVVSEGGLSRLELDVDSRLTLDFVGRNFDKEDFLDTHFLVVFSAAITLAVRQTNYAPFFSGKGIANSMRLPLLSVSDPTLAMSAEVRLAWYAGNSVSGSLVDHIAEVIDLIAAKTGRHPILFGASGGGFAALNVLKALKSSATAVVANPQTSITSYPLRAGVRYVATAFPALSIPDEARKNRTKFRSFVESELPDTMFTVPDVNDFGLNKRLVYLQNRSDAAHLKNHAAPWFEKKKFVELGRNFFCSLERNIAFFVGNWGSGHAAAPASLLRRVFTALLENQAFIPTTYRALCFSDYQAEKKFAWVTAIDLEDQVQVDFELVDSHLHVTCEVLTSWEKGELEYAFYVKSGPILLDSRKYDESSVAIFDKQIFEKSVNVTVYLCDETGTKRSKTVRYKLPGNNT